MKCVREDKDAKKMMQNNRARVTPPFPNLNVILVSMSPLRKVLVCDTQTTDYSWKLNFICCNAVPLLDGKFKLADRLH